MIAIPSLRNIGKQTGVTYCKDAGQFQKAVNGTTTTLTNWKFNPATGKCEVVGGQSGFGGFKP